MIGNKIKIAVVVSQFNHKVTVRLHDSALARLNELNIKYSNADIIWVPGAVEIPLIAQQFAKGQRCHAVICLGAVIRGQTSHYDYVCDMVARGCQKISLEHNIPIVFGILTTENVEQALARSGGTHGDKGREAVDTAVRMVNVMRQFKNEQAVRVG